MINLQSGRAERSKGRTITIWAVKALLVVAFGAAGIAKLLGEAHMVAVFEQLGIGQWFRYVTGLIELTGAILLLIPTTAAVGALALCATMIGAILSHLFLIDGSPLPALALLCFSGFVLISEAPKRNSATGTAH